MNRRNRGIAVICALLMVLAIGFALPSEGEAAAKRVRRAAIGQRQRAAAAPSMFTRGAGTQNNPYVITTGAQLLAFSSSVGSGNCFIGKYVRLGADIDLRDVVWVHIGIYNDNGGLPRPFRGFFDGAGFTIHNLGSGNSVRPADSLFGFTENATIVNVNLQSALVEGNSNVGSLVGFMTGSVLANCSVSGVVRGHSAVGGIVGSAFKGVLENCSFSGTVTGGSGVGGVAGTVDQTMMRDCRVMGRVDGGADVGGFVGGMLKGAAMGCFADTVTVQGEQNVGGFVGNMVGQGHLDRAAFRGQVLGGISVGGLVGSMADGDLLSCSVAGDVKGQSSVGGVAGELLGGKVLNCTSDAAINGVTNIGGLVGMMAGGGLNDGLNNGIVRGGEAVGGIVGNFAGGDLNPASNRSTGSVQGYMMVDPMIGNAGF